MSQILLSQSSFYFEEFSFLVLFALWIILSQTANVLEQNFLELENVFVKHYAPNHMPDPKGERSLKENYSELHYGNIQKLISSSTPWSVTICQISKAVLQIFCSQGCCYTKCICLKKGNKPTENFRNRFKS